MNTEYPLDYQRLLLLIVVSIVVFIYILIKRKSFIESYRNTKGILKASCVIILIGLIFLLIASIGLSFSHGEWDINYLKEFIMFKDVGADYSFSHMRSIGSFFISTGIILLIVISLSIRQSKLDHLSENKKT